MAYHWILFCGNVDDCMFWFWEHVLSCYLDGVMHMLGSGEKSFVRFY